MASELSVVSFDYPKTRIEGAAVRISSRPEVPDEVMAAAKSILAWNKMCRGLGAPYGPSETLMATYIESLSQATPEVPHAD